MPNTFNADGSPDMMSNQDQLAYLKATGGTIGGASRSVAAPVRDVGTVDPQAARDYESRTAAEDAERRAMPKRKQTSFGLPMTGK
jgi:hypothetical protein